MNELSRIIRDEELSEQEKGYAERMYRELNFTNNNNKL